MAGSFPTADLLVGSPEQESRVLLFLAIELIEHLIVAPASLLGMCSIVITEHLVNLHTAPTICRRACRARLIWRWGPSVVMAGTVVGRIEALSRLRRQAGWGGVVPFLRLSAVGIARLLRREGLIAHCRSSRRCGGAAGRISILIATTAVLAGFICTIAGTRIGMRRLGRMRILIVRVIIRRGTLKTDTFIMLSRGSLPMGVIRLSSRGVWRVWIWRGRVTMGGRWIAVLRLSMRSWGS